MKIVKFLIVTALLLCVLMSASYFTLAETEWSADLTLKQTATIADDNTFSVRVSVSDITSKSGIVCAIYHVCYDPSAVELVSWKNAYPAGWDFSGESSFGAEDWTSILEDDNGNSYLMYTIMNTSLEKGVVSDNVLYTDLHFKVRPNATKTTEIRVTNISFMDKDLEDDCLLSDRKLKISLIKDEPSEAESSEDSSQTTSSEIEESSEPEESSVSQEPSHPTESSEPEESSRPTESTESAASSAPAESSEIEESSIDESETESEEESNETSAEESTMVSTPESADNSVDASKTESQTSEQSETTESIGKRVVMTVLLKDIKDEYGISALQFKLNYKPSMLKFVDYEIVLPENWDLNTEYTEDLCSVGTNGELMFCVMNYQVGCGVKADGVLGFRIEFEVSNVEFDPSLITMSDILLINDNLEEVTEESYQLSITYEDENGTISDESFISQQDEGKALKIVITVVACVVLLAIAISAVVIIRKKKQA